MEGYGLGPQSVHFCNCSALALIEMQKIQNISPRVTPQAPSHCRISASYQSGLILILNIDNAVE